MYPAPTGHLSSTPSRLMGSLPMRYPSPFFDIASTWYPRTVRELLQYCRVYFYTQPLIAATINKLARYPVTDVVFTHNREAVRLWWMWFVRENLHFRSFLISSHLDTLVQGNCFCSIIYPFIRQLTCADCGNAVGAKPNMDYWSYGAGRFELVCPKCRHRGPAKVKDYHLKSPKGIKLHRWDPMDVVIDDGDYPGTTRYLYRVPRILSNAIRLGKKSVVSVVPLEFLEAVEQGKMAVFSATNFFHMKRQILSGKHKGWGMPLIAPVLKYAFYLQIMMKSQEQILTELMVPLRVVFPQAASTTSDPYSNVLMDTWKKKIESEIRRWKADNCVHPNTWVESERGLIQAKDVVVGDLLKTHLGRYRLVEATSSRNLHAGEKAYRIHSRGLTAVDTVFSENHPIWAARSFNNGNGHKVGSPEYIPVKDLRSNDYVGYPVSRSVVQRDTLDLANYVERACTGEWIYTDHTDSEVPKAFEYLEKNGPSLDRESVLQEMGWSVNQYKIAQIAFREGRTLRRTHRHQPFDKELAWVVGMYLSEGNVTPKQVMFGLHQDEENIITRLRTFFEERFGAESFVVQRSEQGVQLYISSKIAAEFIHGLCPGLAGTKAVPKIYMEAEEELVRSLLSGLFQGDGCVTGQTCGGTHLIYATVSRQLAADTRTLLLSLGIPAGWSNRKPTVSVIKGRTIQSNGCYIIEVCGTPQEHLYPLMEGRTPENTFRPQIGTFAGGYFWHRIRTVEEVPVSEVPVVLDFRVAEDHSFCTMGVCTSNSYIPVLPLPIGHQTIGGEGRSLLLGGEIRLLLEQIIAALEVPLEFVFAGTSYSASMVALRQLENLCLSTVEDDRELLRWVVESVSSYLKYPKPDDMYFKPFKTADDLARKQFLMALAQSGRVSGHTLCAANDLDYGKELELIKEEAKIESSINQLRGELATEAQGSAGIVAAKYQVRAQAAAAQQAKSLQQGPMTNTTPPGGIGGPQGTEQPYPSIDNVLPSSPIQDNGLSIEQGIGNSLQLIAKDGQVHVSLIDAAKKIADSVATMASGQRETYLNSLRSISPQLFSLVSQMIQGEPEFEQESGVEIPTEQRPSSREVASI